MPLSNLEKLALLLDEEEFPAPVYPTGQTDDEIVASPPDGLRHDHHVDSAGEMDLLYGPAYNNPNIDIVLSSSDEEYGHVPMRKSAKAPKMNFSQTRRVPPVLGNDASNAIPPLLRSNSEVADGWVSAGDSTQAFIWEIGSLAPHGQPLSPILAVSKYPYKFVSDKELSERIAQEFFVDGKFWRREWEIYYVWPPHSVGGKPLFFIPTQQVTKLLTDINKTLANCHLTLPSHAEDIGLALIFDSHPEMAPRYLGRSASKDKFNTLERHCPGENYRPNGELKATKPPAATILQDFKRKAQLVKELSKAKSKATQATREEQRHSKQQGWKTDLKQTERFLGLRPEQVIEPKGDPFEAKDESWAEVQAKEAARLAAKYIPHINVHHAPPYPFEKSVVFISIDIECYEKDKAKVTEIGLSTLDTQDLSGVAPGQHGVKWRPVIRSRHFRIREYAHLRNTEYVEGDPAAFCKEFGKSEFITLAEAPAAIATCFRPPYSAPGLPILNNVDKSLSSDSKRTLVLVGHDITNDIRYLRSLGYDVTNLSDLATIDTAILYRALMHEWNPKSLGGLMVEFDIPPYKLHNAGNDARYTMEVMLAIAIKSGTDRGSKEQKKMFEQKRKERVEAATKEAAVRAMEEGEGWSSDEQVPRGKGVTLG